MSDGEEDVFTLNGFMFCAEHGNELCNKCYADYRIGNNLGHLTDQQRTQIWKEIGKVSKGIGSLDERKPLKNVFSFGAVDTGKRNNGMKVYKCQEHDKDNCKECFDWVRIITSQGKTKEKGKVIDRQQILRFLKSMDVVLPPETKMPDEALERRLSNAISYSQQISSLGVFPVNPKSLDAWKTEAKSLFEAINRTSMHEAMRNYTAQTRGASSPFPDLYADSFMDVRQTMLHIAKNYENGIKAFILQDRECNEAICMRILEVRKINKDTPVFFVLYEAANIATPIQSTFQFVDNLVKAGRGLPQIQATTEEQAFLRKLLFENSQRISSEYKPKKENAERTFTVSCLLPIGPLSQVDIGRLTINTGCEVCGEKAASRCSQCQSASYCGSACQKSHWKAHKALCKSLKDASWDIFNFTTGFVVAGQKLVETSFSVHGPLKGMTPPDANAPDIQPNIHGDKPFVIKIQRPLTNNPGDGLMTPFRVSTDPEMISMLVYDRQRSFRVHVRPQDNPVTYAKAMTEMPKGKSGLKIYRWAKRTGDNQLSVCLDRGPEPEPTW